MKQVVQGDILFVRVEGVGEPTGYDKQESRIIALGEKTGHAHVLDGNADLFANSFGIVSWLRAYDDVEIRHDEHGPARLEKGDYRIVRQRVHDYKAHQPKRVVD